MGTTCTHKPKGMPVVDFLVSHGCFTWSEDSPFTARVLDSALVNLTEFYAAVEHVDKQTGDRRVWAAVFKITMIRGPKRDRWTRDDSWDHNFCYKDMDESMGPYQTNCPERILKLLTPTEHEYAVKWREACWAKIEAKKARPKIKPGTCLLYGGRVYRTEQSLGARGWRTYGFEDGLTWRLKRSQVAASEVLCTP